MKPVGSSGISATEPAKNAADMNRVAQRCFRHQAAMRMYARMAAPTACAAGADGLRM